MKNKNTKKIFKKRRSTLKTRGGDIEKDTAKIHSKCLNLQIELDEVIKDIYNDPNTSISTKDVLEALMNEFNSKINSIKLMLENGQTLKEVITEIREHAKTIFDKAEELSSKDLKELKSNAKKKNKRNITKKF
tara:strand:+ start:62 stop:460 length:399 start_codon:yes stop_codon:yes gene_type:complete